MKINGLGIANISLRSSVGVTGTDKISANSRHASQISAHDGIACSPASRMLANISARLSESQEVRTSVVNHYKEAFKEHSFLSDDAILNTLRNMLIR